MTDSDSVKNRRGIRSKDGLAINRSDWTNRSDLVASFPRNAVAAEIGVWDGDFSEVILGSNCPSKLFLIDCWECQSLEVFNDPSNAKDTVQRKRHASVIERFADDRRVVVLKSFSVQAASLFCDKYFDWLYIDANHMQVDKDIEAWWPKIKPGGWLSGHDYCVVGDFINVQPLVDQFAESHGLRLYVTDDETFPSWAIQKPAQQGDG